MTTKIRNAPALLLVLAVTIGTPACAAQVYATRSGYSQDFRRNAYENGYRAGLERGRDDFRHRRGFALDRYSEYRDSDRGYRRGDGDRDVYRNSFRQGFADGYRIGFGRR